MISKELMENVQNEFDLSLDGIHGVSHWVRVYENGRRLAELVGISPQVVELFAILHDSKRQSDGTDPDHGRRAAEFAKTLQGSLIELSNEDLKSLVYACEQHSNGLTEANITVQVCWDADRLDLGRIGIMPDARFLCTPAAKDPEVIKWAYERSSLAGEKGWEFQ